MDLCESIYATSPDLPAFGARVLGLFLCVRLTLTYLRHNLPQELLAEVYGVSQATVSRVIAAYMPLIAQALRSGVPTVEDLAPTAQLIVDGTLLESWSWKNPPRAVLR
ncbi:helix-turn-helix domain-containing protein [Actinomyces oris]|uniref:helix-turn-helix domain-containing protein n=1 Tax=Actinomyces oris TaxID=544580 RepID=UPI00242EBB81|nr:transposase family protein [Actinomyces oris]